MTAAPALFDTAESRDALRAVRTFPCCRLDVFGSAATGKGFDPDRSDLDLVEFETLPSGDAPMRILVCRKRAGGLVGAASRSDNFGRAGGTRISVSAWRLSGAPLFIDIDRSQADIPKHLGMHAKRRSVFAASPPDRLWISICKTICCGRPLVQIIGEALGSVRRI
ncbi:MAG: hypothetical protein U1E70_13175 [Acetobacteraceae bacterium]